MTPKAKPGGNRASGSRVSRNYLAAHQILYAGGDPRGQFIDAMRRAGIHPAEPERIVADGTICRFRVEGDKQGSRNGWAVLFTSPIPAGAFGSWKLNYSEKWHAGRNPLLPSQRKRLNAEIERAKCQHEAERQEKQEKARRRAFELWNQAAVPMADHPYLAHKHVQAHGIRQLNRLLLVPMRNADGALWGLQFIGEDGAKRFLSGARKRGLYHAIGSVADELLIAEGYATAASIFEATEKPVAVAFDAGNLEPVALALRTKFPDAAITIMGDNDAGTPGNPGLTKARAAARAVGANVALPPEPYNDFNDVASAGGSV